MRSPLPGRGLRVLLVAGAATGGLRGHVATLARGLIERGLNVTLVAPAVTVGAIGPDVPSVIAPVGSLDPSALARTLLVLRRGAADSDVIHAHGLRAGAAAASAGIHPLVISWHNAALGRHLGLRAHAAAEAFQASRAEVILAVSPDLAERADRAGARRTELIEVPPGALPPPSHPPAVVLDRLQIDPRRPVVLAVARLEAQKRLDVLVAAAQAWQRPDAPVVLIAGSGRLRDALHRQIDRTKAPVRLLGPRDDVADLLSVASVLALPSRWEGWPATVVEAVRAQVPVVAADSPGVARLLGPQACLVPPGDAEALRSALEHVLDNPATARSLAGAATRRAAAWQTVEAAMDWTLDLYLDLVSSYRA